MASSIGQQHHHHQGLGWTHVFEILKQIGDRLSLAVGESGLVEAIAGSPWNQGIGR